MMKLGED